MKYNVVPCLKPGTEETIYRAQIITSTKVGFEQLASEITSECTVTPHDIKAVLSALESSILRHLQLGNSVKLGDLGSFRCTIRSKSAKREKDFKLANITGAHIVFTGSKNLKFNLSKASPLVTFEMEKTAVTD